MAEHEITFVVKLDGKVIAAGNAITSEDIEVSETYASDQTRAEISIRIPTPIQQSVVFAH